MRISQLAERSGVPASTLRYYESAGLLPAGRTGSGYRTYDADSLDRLSFISAGKRLGLSLTEIGELVGVWESDACMHVRAQLRPLLTARLTEAEQESRDLALLVDGVRDAIARLDRLRDRDGPCDDSCGLTTDPVPRAERRVACTLDGAGMAGRRSEWHEATAGAVRRRVPGGLELDLPADRAPRIAELAVAEQSCCPFLDLRLRIDVPRLVLTVTGPEEAASMLTDLLDLEQER